MEGLPNSVTLVATGFLPQSLVAMKPLEVGACINLCNKPVDGSHKFNVDWELHQCLSITLFSKLFDGIGVYFL